MRRYVLQLAVVTILLAPQVPIAAQSSGFIWQRGPLPPLENSRTFVVQGIPHDGGCSFAMTDNAPADAPRWVVRQLALDFDRCLAVTEEGAPGPDFRPPSADGYDLAPTARAGGLQASPTGSSGGKLARPLGYTNAGYTEYWYNDGWGNLQTKTHTDIDWTFDGSCVTDINVGGYYQWNSSGFNSPTNTSASADVDGGGSCSPGNSVGNGRLYAVFQEKGGSCTQEFWPASAQGNQSGGINYGPYSVNSNCSA